VAPPCAQPEGGATGRAGPPTGLIAYDIYSPNQGLSPFSPSLFSDSSISGVDLAIGWQDLEPSDGEAPGGTPTTVNWGVLDCLFDEAAKASPPKFVVLTLEPGFDTPSWALPSGAWFMSSFAYHSQKTARPLPEPWDQTYLDEWFTFLAQVKTRYEPVPGFRMIAAAGPTSVSSEMSLPDLKGGKTCVTDPGDYKKCDVGASATAPWPGAAPWLSSYDGSDIKMFEALGYTPALLVSAWTSVFYTYTHDFADQYVSLALWQGLPIGSTSKGDRAQYTATPLQVIQAGSQYPSQFVLQANGLGPMSGQQPPGAFVAANCGTVVTGFQTKAPEQEPVADLPGALSAAEQAGVDFAELYEPDDILVAQPTPAKPDPPLAATAQWLASTVAPPPKLPASASCGGDSARLRLTSLEPAPVGSYVTLTARTTVNLANLDFEQDGYSFKAAITISRGSDVLKSCSGAQGPKTCSVKVEAAPSATTYTADIGYPGEVPVVSANTTVKGFTVPGKGKGGCPKAGSTCV